MKFNALTAGLVFAFIIGVTTVGCEPPETEDGPNESETSSEVSDDGPADIDDGGIDAIPDDPELVEQGEDLFNREGCSGCHQMDSAAAGPALGDVTQRRSPSWLAKQIMHPDEMGQRDPETQKLRDEFHAPMPPTNLDAEQARALLAYLGTQ